MKNLVISFVLAATLLTGSSLLLAQTETAEVLPENVPDLLVKANSAFTAKDYPTFRRAMQSLHKKRPNNGQYMYQLVIAHALLDEKRQAYDLMVRMQQQGLAYDFTESENTMSIRDTQIFDYINDLMTKAANPVGDSEKVYVLPDSVKMPGTISWDESRQKFLIGTIADGSIFAVGMDGQASELLRANDENGLWAIFDILVDHANNRLWVSSAYVPGFSRHVPADKGRSALFEFDLESLQLIRRYPVPVDNYSHSLGSMVLSPNGDIYIADRAVPLIYRKPAGEQKLRAEMALQDMISIRGMTMQPDGRILYVADREMGIMVVDVESRRAGTLAGPATLNLGGIDGLYLRDNRLFVIQNGNQPQRVMRLQLDSTGTRVESVRPLAVAQPEFDYPSFGALHGDELYYFANSQWPGKKGPQKAVTVLKTPLNASGDLVQPDLQHFMEQQQKRQEEQVRKAEKN